MQRICLFPGTFDPITLGHTDIIDRALELFDEVVVGIGVNATKIPMFPVEQRQAWIRDIYKNQPKVKALTYEGLTIKCCQTIGARYILRGIRSFTDFEYEKAIAEVNRMMDPSIETYFLNSSPNVGTLASTLVRDVIRNSGDASRLLPAAVWQSVKKP
ncbi:Phosphopantetheine adenylyltransferase [Chitinophaga costaii]|uniref:Phosphopantetheine adenylyltransferase n=1 Tax=Chitinophaga costaii TaxID=1335309 RepID=A0A1C4E642_9BACT|nr:pantetheine-phosphate adenylyltransferase [Chitinophaga costaii]PUZ24299.1 pantetheine-phosphate adenylyltransferase [Chitinophaga costaii]SCC39068.1 Phosphopantetheine adenylyltransferase [Chitinophaga costaii]